MPPKPRFAFNKIPLVIGSVAILIMMMVTVIHVIGRSLFSSPLYGGIEIISLSGVLLISFAIGYTQSERGHIIIEIMVSRLPKRLQLPFAIFSLCISLITVGLFVWGTFSFAWEAVIKPGSLTPVLHWPAAPFKFILVAGGIILWLYFAYHLIGAMRKLRSKETDEPLS